MNSAPVNSLSLDLIVDLRKALQSASRDKDCVGIILASSCRVFSAGLDMREMHGTSSDHLVTFWTELQSKNTALYLPLYVLHPCSVSPLRPPLLALRGQASCDL